MTPAYYVQEYKKLAAKYKKQLHTLKGEYSIDFEKYDTEKKVKAIIRA